eukprot:TRINITY_DN36927_c0_g1_i1.p1 TRINITY_DN36927_c0_g1~~TRINITY_DN36927_c0_g1_i1.p1  ORF type:complete len:564 (-),score=92.50 TRINITY_DN36927_c0_g1_i1:71-1606(-)
MHLTQASRATVLPRPAPRVSRSADGRAAYLAQAEMLASGYSELRARPRLSPPFPSTAFGAGLGGGDGTSLAWDAKSRFSRVSVEQAAEHYRRSAAASAGVEPRTPEKMPEAAAEAAPVSDVVTPPKGLWPGQERQRATLPSRLVADDKGSENVGVPTAVASPQGHAVHIDVEAFDVMKDLPSRPHLGSQPTQGRKSPKAARQQRFQSQPQWQGHQQAAALLRQQIQQRQQQALKASPPLQWKQLPAGDKENCAASFAGEFLEDFSITAPWYGAAAAARSLEKLPHQMRQALLFLRSLPMFPQTSLEGSRPFLLPLRPDEKPKPTLVLDLDETLVHCSRGARSPMADIVRTPDLVVEFDDGAGTGRVFFRPYVNLFLQVAAVNFELVVFTASQQSYADQVINALDPTGTFISGRLYRQHCTEYRGAYFKELGLLGRPLSKTVLVDNSPISVACNQDLGILIRSWYGDLQDQELLSLLSLMEDMRMRAPKEHGGNFDRYLESRYGLREFFQAL